MPIKNKQTTRRNGVVTTGAIALRLGLVFTNVTQYQEFMQVVNEWCSDHDTMMNEFRLLPGTHLAVEQQIVVDLAANLPEVTVEEEVISDDSESD